MLSVMAFLFFLGPSHLFETLLESEVGMYRLIWDSRVVYEGWCMCMEKPVLQSK